MSASGSPEPIAGPAVGRPRAKSFCYPHSVIRNLDISNINGVRDVMRVISRYNSLPYFEVVREDPLENSGLPAQQHAVAKRIIMAIHATIRTHPLLFRAVVRWCSFSENTNYFVKKSCGELNDLAEGRVLCAPTRFPDEYQVALGNFDQMEAIRATLVTDDDDDDDDDDDEDDDDEHMPRAKKERKGRNGKGGIATKSPTKASPPKNGVGKKRGPVSMFKSCENCKKTHYKCDKAQPTCGRCAARGWECRSQVFSGASKAVFKEE
ncbi:hypothetical protein HYALB_00013676 [Hymenoscyphus albidus]|uniref:Zn(2)-C6 fungal-type domain-containing protein n=1 Tax=Hymenoscyphus albidus TaxID=595503 RepID=A0A9N9LV93_9HELO|nr:hypothetical protein HYALB_00013676 [Hymenoscyphus albidus]